MRTKNKIISIVSLAIFSFGFLVGMTLLILTTWGDLEAALFDAAIRGDESLSTLKCPVLITTSEVSAVSASITNTHVRPVERRIRVHISDGLATLMREELSELPLSPGKTQKIQWTVTPEDAAFGKVILVRVYMFRSSPLSSRDGSCGILVVDLPNFTGEKIYASLAATSFLCITIGAGLWITSNKPLKGRKHNTLRALLLLAGSLIVGTVFSFLGWWILGTVFVAVTVLLIFYLPYLILMR